MTKRPSHVDIQSDASGSDGVGTTGQDLREQREALGEQLGDIAETLCIRLDFLKALEAGDYDALPGPAYAVGFVRSYARHLGMDSDKMAWQFKVEVSGETPTAKLDFLTPVQESRIPRGAIVLVTVLLCSTIYGVWYYMNARDLTFTDIIPEVPLQLGRTAQAPAPVAGARAPANGAIKEFSATEPADKVTTDSPDEGAVGDGTESGPATGGAAPSPMAAMDGQLAVSPAPATSPPAAAEPASTVPPSPVAKPAPPAEAVVENPPPVAADDVAPPPSPSMEAAAVPSAAPAESALPTVATRIEIRAKADSWVQMRTASGKLLMTRVVSKGTSFAVPPQDGLKLTTGNAGGLEILVDGVVVPALGPFGAVRRDVALDPERLKAGTAVAR